MLIIMLSAVLFILIIYLWMRWVQLKQYWTKRGVPCDKPHPLLGSLTFIQRENPAHWIRRMYNDFKGPYVGIWIFWKPALVINSEKIAQNILIRDQANFRNRLASSGTTDPIGAFNLFMVNDPLWSVLRKRLSASFTASKLRGIQNILTAKSKELVERIRRDRLKTKPIDLKCIMTDYTTDIIGTSTFGMASDATLTGESYMRIITHSYEEFELFRALSWCCIFFLPEWVDFFRFKMFPTKSTESLRNILRTTIAQRGGLQNPVTDPRDLLDILIKIKQDDKELDIMTEDMMLSQAATFVQAGFESSSITLTFCIYELAFLPELQDKLYAELQEAKDKHGEDLLEASNLAQLMYLNCVINETLRKYPVLTWLDRIASEDYKVDDHLTIKAGTPVLINVLGMHLDPNLYPEPEKFIPDRFLPENRGDVKTCAFLPFGEGPRICIGQRLGYSMLRHALTAVILGYKVKPLPNAPLPSEVNLHKKTMFATPEDILSVEFFPRN